MLHVFFALLLFISTLEAHDEITVHLDTEVPLLPLFLSDVESSKSSFSKEHLASVKDVLAFDLYYNGSTKVLSSNESSKKPSLKKQNDFDAEYSFDALRKDEVLYLVKLKGEKKELKVQCISVNSQKARVIEITLTGDLVRDRRSVHALADTIHEALFQKPGIASSKILFTIKKETKKKLIAEVFESDYDGKNMRQLTHEEALCTHPLYISPDSYCFVSYKIGQPKIYYAPLQGGTPQRASLLKGNQLTPSLARDSSCITFACDVTTTSDLFIQPFRKEVGPIGKPYHLFAAKGAAQASPVFSPDGKKIAFVSDKDGSPKIYVIDTPAPGTKLRDIKPILITKRCRENSAPSWSPDGTKLAYSAKNSGARQIWIYDFETARERQLTSGKSCKENPAWAKDSLHLLFNTKDDSSELFLVNLNQPEAVCITSGSGEKLFPSWEP